MKQIKKCLLSMVSTGFLCAALILGANAFAAGTDPCAEDLAKFCPYAETASATMQCLESHENELTDACRAHEIKMHGKRGEMKESVQEQKTFRQACNDDMVLFCKDTDPADGGIMGCLTNHEKELSVPCAESLKTMKAGKE